MRRDAMNWEAIGEIVSKYWVEQLCVLALGVITWLYRRQVKRLEENAREQKAFRRAMVAI